MKLKLIASSLFLPIICCVQAQGFINLNFESAKFTPHPAGGSFVYASNAVPGWTPYFDGFANDYVSSNGISLGGPQVSIETTNNVQGYLPVQGKFFLLLGGSFSGGNSTASIGQTGQIPLSAQSILFWGSIFGSLDVSFNGNALSFAAAGTTVNNYTIYQADVSTYAGQIGELLFSSPFNTHAFIDNIQFSSTAVPEPGILAFTVLGGLGLFLIKKRQRR